MALYTGIAPYYDLLFHYDPVQISFLEHVINPSFEWAAGIRDGQSCIPENSFLDIGCGTGTTISAFTERFELLVGIDSNTQLLDCAVQKVNRPQKGAVKFLNADMREIGDLFSEEKFNLVSCLGNTLIHLTEPGSITSFIKQVYQILDQKGVFIFQTMNYDRILDEGIRELPIITRETVRFEQYYSMPQVDGLISFDTLLVDSQNEIEINNSTLLYPVRKTKLQEILHIAGFSQCSFYGDFTGSPWSPESSLCIGVCER